MSVSAASRPLIWWCAVLTVIILFGVVVYRTGSALYHNHQYVRVSAATASPYQQGSTGGNGPEHV